MKIAYCTWTDPYNMRSWSGIQYAILNTLKKQYGTITVIGPINNKYIFWGKLINRILNVLFKINFTYKATTIVSKEFSRQLNKKLKNIEADVLFFPGGSEMIAYLETDTPIIYLTDSTFNSMINYYEEFSNILPLSLKMGDYIESQAIKKASKVILASEWAKESVISDYNCPKDKIHVIPFGANLEKKPERNEILNIRKNRPAVCKMLLVGVDWERKGCQIAFNTMVKLNERGVDTELTICGCSPPSGIKHDKLKTTGFLNKNIQENKEKIDNLYYNANIFIFPSRKECAGIALCEASAYGLPIVTTDTGGISNYIENNKNGHLLPEDATADKYADAVESIIEDQSHYYDYAVASRNKFERELNWDSWAKEISKILGKT